MKTVPKSVCYSTFLHTHTHTQCFSIDRPLIKNISYIFRDNSKEYKYECNMSLCTHKAPCTVSQHRTAYINFRTNSLHKPPPCIVDRMAVNRNMVAVSAKKTSWNRGRHKVFLDMALCPLENCVSAELALYISSGSRSPKKSTDLEDGYSKSFRNVRNYLPVNRVSCPRKRESSSARDERTRSMAQCH